MDACVQWGVCWLLGEVCVLVLVGLPVPGAPAGFFEQALIWLVSGAEPLCQFIVCKEHAHVLVGGLVSWGKIAGCHRLKIGLLNPFRRSDTFRSIVSFSLDYYHFILD